jgi:hypothetical protein
MAGHRRGTILNVTTEPTFRSSGVTYQKTVIPVGSDLERSAAQRRGLEVKACDLAGAVRDLQQAICGIEVQRDACCGEISKVDGAAGHEVLKLRPCIVGAPHIGAERSRVVDHQLATAEEADARLGAGCRADFEGGAAFDVEQAGAAWIDSCGHIERASDCERTIVGEVCGRIVAGQCPFSAAIVDDRLELKERAIVDPAYRAGATGEL